MRGARGKLLGPYMVPLAPCIALLFAFHRAPTAASDFKTSPSVKALRPHLRCPPTSLESYDSQQQFENGVLHMNFKTLFVGLENRDNSRYLVRRKILSYQLSYALGICSDMPSTLTQIPRAPQPSHPERIAPRQRSHPHLCSLPLADKIANICATQPGMPHLLQAKKPGRPGTPVPGKPGEGGEVGHFRDSLGHPFPQTAPPNKRRTTSWRPHIRRSCPRICASLRFRTILKTEFRA